MIHVRTFSSLYQHSVMHHEIKKKQLHVVYGFCVSIYNFNNRLFPLHLGTSHYTGQSTLMFVYALISTQREFNACLNAIAREPTGTMVYF